MRVNLTIEETIKEDLAIIANVKGKSLGELGDEVLLSYIDGQDEKVKAAVETARKARK